MRRRRVLVVLLALLLGFVAIEAQLVRLQVFEHEIWSSEARRSSTRFISLPFERGWILDRDGEPFAMTEEVRSLSFSFRQWRKGTTLGAIVALGTLLDEERPELLDVFERAEDWLSGVASIRLSDIAALEPRQRRADIGWYIGRMLGDEVEDAFYRRMAARDWEAGARLGELSGFQAAFEAARQTIELEREALAALEQVASRTRTGAIREVALLAGMGRAVTRADARVARALSSRAEPDETDPGAAEVWRFKRLRALHADLDSDPALLADDVVYDAETLLGIRGRQLAGLSVTVRRRRVYPAGTVPGVVVADTAPLLIGRVGAPAEEDMSATLMHRRRLADLASLSELTEQELKEYERLVVKVREINYAFDDERGITGLERALEPWLRGKRGWISSSVGPDGQLAPVDSAEPVRGLNVTLTLDVGLQAACERVLDEVYHDRGDWPGPLSLPDFAFSAGQPERGWCGAIVLLDPRTGAVRALATGPRPTRAALVVDYAALSVALDMPLGQRALGIGRPTPPGSTFKPVTALAALGAGVLTPDDEFDCRKTLPIGNDSLDCLFHHGPLSLTEALARSCNIYFYHVAERVGGSRLHALATRFGFGGPTHLLAGNEVLAARGVVPGDGLREWVKDGLMVPRPRSMIMRMGIGQVPLDIVTPLQVAAMAGALGTGVYRPPMLLTSMEGYGSFGTRQPVSLGVSAAHLGAVQRGLEQAVDSNVGTARQLGRELLSDPELSGLGLTVAGKTGTPEVEGRPTHSWFVGYLPQHGPRLAFSVLLEHTGEHGGDACVPVFRRLLDMPELRLYLEREGLP